MNTETKKERKPRTRKPKAETPVIVIPDATAPVITENTDVSTVKKEDETNANDAAAAPTVILVGAEQTVRKFKMGIIQREDGHVVLNTSLTFELNDEQAVLPDLIVGTALYSLFEQMELGKVFKTRLFDSRKPLEINIESEHVHINLGNVRKEFYAKMKVNNGERSKLQFVQQVIALANIILNPVVVMRATELLADKALDASQKYGKDIKSSLPYSQLRQIAGTTLKVAPDGVLTLN